MLGLFGAAKIRMRQRGRVVKKGSQQTKWLSISSHCIIIKFIIQCEDMDVFTKIKHWEASKEAKVEHNDRTDNVVVFPLLPVKDNSNAYYASLLDKAVHDGCYNIALLGGYGAGKSSILKSFISLKSNKRKRIKYISCLPYVTVLSRKEAKNLTQEKVHKGIQKEILKQIVFGEKISRLPKLKYSRTRKELSRTTKLLNMSISACFSLLVASFLGCIESNSELVCAAISSILFLLTYCAFTILCEHPIRSLRLEKMEVSLKCKDEDTQILDSFVDDILYIFEAGRYDIVIIEDLDRFGDPLIFEDLRRINNILNSAMSKNISFIYAVKDDVFADSVERTKFFDFILHTVPVSSQYNMADYVTRNLCLLGYNAAEFMNITKILSRNIYDLRVLNDIFNAFVAFRHQILEGKLTWLNPEKLLAMLVFRSQFPGEFDKIRTHSSILDIVFTECNEYSSKKLKSENNLLLNILNPDPFLSAITIGVKAVYDGIQYVQSYPATVKLGTRDLDINNLDARMLADELLKGEKLIFSRNGYSPLNDEYDLKKLSTVIPNLKDACNIITTNAESVRDNIMSLRTPNKFSFVGEIDLQNCFSKSKIQDSEAKTLQILLKDLLEAGLIDDSYQLYASRFLGIANDKEVVNFNMNYLNLRKSNFELVLQSKQILAILDTLDGEDLRNPALYNYSIFDYLISKSDERLDTILTPTQKNFSTLLDFFISYYSHCAAEDQIDNAKVVLKAILEIDRRQGLLAVLKQVKASDDDKLDLVAQTIRYLPNCDDLHIDAKDYEFLVLRLSNFSKLLDTDTQLKLVQLFVNSGIRVSELSLFGNRARDYLIDNGAVVINLNNVLSMNVEQIQNILQREDIDPPTLKNLLAVLASSQIQTVVKIQVLQYLNIHVPSTLDAVESQALIAAYDKEIFLPSREIFQLFVQSGEIELLVGLLSSLNTYKTEQILEYLKMLPGDYPKFARPMTRPVIVDTPVNHKLVQELKRRGVVSSTKCKNGNILIYLTTKEFQNGDVDNE